MIYVLKTVIVHTVHVPEFLGSHLKSVITTVREIQIKFKKASAYLLWDKKEVFDEKTDDQIYHDTVPLNSKNMITIFVYL